MQLRISTVTVGAADPVRLAEFYRRLLDLEYREADPTGAGPAGADPTGTAAPEGDPPDWIGLRDPRGGVALAVQYEPLQPRPVWPADPGAPQMMLHLEIQVDDLDAAVAHALACGAEPAAHQPQPDVRVCLDPAGHPFCLWVPTS